MIELIDIGFKYPKKTRPALRDVSLRIAPGEIFTLLGPNAAGKTTLVKVISGLIIPQSGSVIISGRRARGQEFLTGKSIGLVLGDERTFYYRLSGAQNLEFFGGLHGIKRSILKSRIKETLQLVGLVDSAGLQYMRYSTGMKKRLMMARALILDPDIYLLDEPNSGVDPQSAKSLRETILSLRNRNKTILLTTHNMSEAEKMSDRIGFLRDGHLIRVGTLGDFRMLMGQKRLEIAFRPRPISNGEESIQEVMAKIRRELTCTRVDAARNRLRISYNGDFDLTAALAIIGNSGLEISSADTRQASLEEIFIKLMGN
jgi:ABC-2 type transport system ATP-binding protein